VIEESSAMDYSAMDESKSEFDDSARRFPRIDIEQADSPDKDRLKNSFAFGDFNFNEAIQRKLSSNDKQCNSADDQQNQLDSQNNRRSSGNANLQSKPMAHPMKKPSQSVK